MKIFFAFIFMFFTFSSAFAGEDPLRIESIRYGKAGEKTRIVFDLNQNTDFRAFILNDPYRAVIDLPEAEWKTFKSRHVLNEMVKDYRSGVLDSGLTRVIFDLSKPAVIGNIFTLSKDDFNKDRLVIDLHLASDALVKARMDEILGNKDLKGRGVLKPVAKNSDYGDMKNEKVKKETVRAVIPPASPLHKPSKKYTVVVDAGHGGPDAGAISNGVKEKNITLAIAQELKHQMEETGRYKVVLTRAQDTYIKLHERVDISRRVNADLFISIHADKIDQADIRGTAIYTLSEKASDAETERLADEENNAGFVAGVDLQKESQDVADILLDLAMREKMNESNLFARILKTSLIRGNTKLLPNSHRSAGFAVLKAPDVPSVLIETGFISNREEAKHLTSPQFQRHLALAIVDGVDGYFRKIKAIQTP